VGLLDTFGQALGIDRKAVVHRHDLDLAGGVILDRVVGAVMALVHLHRGAAERQRQHLVAKADAEHRKLAAVDQLADHGHGILAGRGRVAGAVGQEHAVGFMARMSSALMVAGTTVTLQPRPENNRRMLRLTPHFEAWLRLLRIALVPLPQFLVPVIALGGGYFPGEVHALKARPLGRFAF
jgi:hypothetical protein